MKVSYRDKYGPLGKISVLIGAIDGATLHVDSWVLSCRAFSRRIEHGCLTELFMRFPVAAIEFDFSPTERNKPLQEFFAGLLGESPPAPFRLSRELFFAKSPRVLHQIEDNVHA
jgi:predicted enzyme involved in methoxymalonyl-ACP biosynthesis